MAPFKSPKRKVFTLQANSSKKCDACRLHCLRSGEPRCRVAIRLDLLLHPLLRSRWRLCALRMRHTPCGCRSASLVAVRPNFRLPVHSINAASAAMPHSAGSLPPCYRHSRLTIVRRGCIVVTIRRDSWRSHVHRTRIAQRVQLFKLQTANVGGRGGLPSPFSGGFKGGILFGKRIPPFGAAARTPLPLPRSRGKIRAPLWKRV